MVVLDACCTDPSHTRVHAHPLMHTHTEIKTDTQTQIFPLTAADPVDMSSLSPLDLILLQQQATSSSFLCVCVCVWTIWSYQNSYVIYNACVCVRLHVCVCVCIIIISHECQRRQGFVVFARLSRAGNCQHCAAPIDAQHARALP